MIQVTTATTVEEFDALLPEWEELLTQAGDRHELFHEPAMIRSMLTDSTDICLPFIVVARRNGRIECIAPFYLRDTKIPLRLSVITLASFSARTLRLFGDSVLLRAGADSAAALAHIFESLRTLRSRFDLIWIYLQRIGDPLWVFLSTDSAALRSFRVVVTTPNPEKVHCLRLDQTFEVYSAEARTKSGFPGKAIRRFWRDAGERGAVTRISQPSQVEAFLSDVNRVFNASWQARTYGGRRRDEAAEIAKFKTIAAAGLLRSYVLSLERQPIAFILGYQCRGHYTYAETSYDSGHSSSSPGSVLTYAAIEDLFRTDTPATLDFGFGDAAYKRTFGNTSYDVCSLYLVRMGRWRLVFGAQRFLNAGYRVSRRALIWLRLDKLVRRVLKRQR